MRNISNTALQQLTTNLGGEPLVIVAIFWNNVDATYYCDRGAFRDLPQLQGKIIKLANLEDVVNISNSSNSQSVSITLDDIDQSIKNIYNVIDIHKKRVIIYQWFTQLNFNDKFILFEGLINSPIVWSEKDRTFSFDIVSKLEDAEVGYSAEEGNFPSIDDPLIGKPWPLPFGTVLKVPTLQIDFLSNLVLMDSFGLHDPGLDVQMENLNAKATFAEDAGILLIIEGGALQFQGDWLSSQDYTDGGFSSPLDGQKQDPAVQQGKQMVAAGNKLLAQAFKMRQDAAAVNVIRGKQTYWEVTGFGGIPPLPPQNINPFGPNYYPPTTPFPIITPRIPGALLLFNGATFPQNTSLTFEVNGMYVTGTISTITGNNRGDSVLNVSSVTRVIPTVRTAKGGEYYYYNSNPGVVYPIAPVEVSVVQGGGFLFARAGAHLRLITPIPQRLIAAMLPCTVLGVYAIRDYGGTKLMTALPTNYYDVSIESFNNKDLDYIQATIITLKQPLMYINDGTNGSAGGWEDQVYVDLVSPVGPNTVDIITWLIQTYTALPYSLYPFGIDSTSFNLVKTQLASFPMNFCLFDRKNLMQVLNEIAFQARCAIYIKNNTFFLLYLVPQGNPIDTITLDDIVFGTLELNHTPTEQLVTKFVANYKLYYGPQTGQEASDIGQKQDKIILRNHILNYGLHEQQYDYYAYTNPYLVDLSATFWLIRKSNTWKLVTFKTPLHKLNIESFDSVTVNLSWASNGSAVGVVQSAAFDSDNMEITFNVWLPVRLGEMTTFQFANPVDSTEFFYPFITDQPGSGGPGENTGGNLKSTTNSNGLTISFPKGSRKQIHDGNPNPGTNQVIIYPVLPNAIGQIDPSGTPVFDSVNENYDLSTALDAALVANKSVPAKIIEVAAAGLPKYRVSAYPQGPINPSVLTGALDATYDVDTNATPLDPGTWVMISQLTYKTQDDSGKTFNKTIKVFIPNSPAGSSSFPGIVLSGSGDTYMMNIFKKGLAGPATVVSVKQLQVNGDNADAGTWAMVSETKKQNVPQGQDPYEYTMQIPTWM